MRVLITGASSGIGKCIAQEFNKLGASLVLVARDKEKLQKVKDSLNGDVEIITMDISSTENCEKLHEMVKDIDVLINNAGFGAFGNFAETDLGKELSLIDTNVKAVHILTKLYLKDMVEKDKGYILNVSSIAGFMPGGPLMAAYYASKSYVLSLSEGIRYELKKNKSKVKISVLCPGPVNTNFNNVAGVKFNLNSKSPEYVAKYAVKSLFKNKFLIIPGFKIKCARILAKISPNNITSKVVYMMQERKR